MLMAGYQYSEHKDLLNNYYKIMMENNHDFVGTTKNVWIPNVPLFKSTNEFRIKQSVYKDDKLLGLMEKLPKSDIINRFLFELIHECELYNIKEIICPTIYIYELGDTLSTNLKGMNPNSRVNMKLDVKLFEEKKKEKREIIIRRLAGLRKIYTNLKVIILTCKFIKKLKKQIEKRKNRITYLRSKMNVVKNAITFINTMMELICKKRMINQFMDMVISKVVTTCELKRAKQVEHLRMMNKFQEDKKILLKHKRSPGIIKNEINDFKIFAPEVVKKRVGKALKNGEIKDDDTISWKQISGGPENGKIIYYCNGKEVHFTKRVNYKNPKKIIHTSNGSITSVYDVNIEALKYCARLTKDIPKAKLPLDLNRRTNFCRKVINICEYIYKNSPVSEIFWIPHICWKIDNFDAVTILKDVLYNFRIY